MKIKKGDKVMVISGKNRGKIGTVLSVLPKKNRVLIEGINIVSKHVKKGQMSKEGGIIKVERPISLSNVMYYEEKLGKPVRVGRQLIDGKAYRISNKTKEVLDIKK